MTKPKAAQKDFKTSSETVLSSEATQQATADLPPPPLTKAKARAMLPPGQHPIFDMLVDGKSYKKIAGLLGLSETSVGTITAAVYDSLKIEGGRLAFNRHFCNDSTSSDTPQLPPLPPNPDDIYNSWNKMGEFGEACQLLVDRVLKGKTHDQIAHTLIREHMDIETQRIWDFVYRQMNVRDMAGLKKKYDEYAKLSQAAMTIAPPEHADISLSR